MENEKINHSPVEVGKYGREGEAARGTTLEDHQVKIAGRFWRILKVTPMMERSSNPDRYVTEIRIYQRREFRSMR